MPAPAGAVRIGIQDATGQTVRTLNLGPTAVGTHDLSWDGLDGQGSRLQAGLYTLKVEGAIDNKAQALTSLVRADVDSVSLPRNGLPPVLNLADYGAVNMDAIRRVM